MPLSATSGPFRDGVGSLFFCSAPPDSALPECSRMRIRLSLMGWFFRRRYSFWRIAANTLWASSCSRIQRQAA